jgi:hypothetical protein
MEAGEKVGSIGVQKVLELIFPPSFQLPCPIECVYLHFSCTLEVDSFGALMEVHMFIYIHSGVIYAFG